MNSINDEIAKRGYAFLEGLRPDWDTARIANEIGIPMNPQGGRLVGELVPRITKAPNTYGGIYGFSHFPFHTDLATWRLPPRYVLLRCVVGYADVPTLLVDGHALARDVTFDILSRAIFKLRRPRQGVLALCRLCEPLEEGYRLRWDEAFLKPASRIGEFASIQVREWLAQSKSLSIALARQADTLLIDNWRMLHARSQICPGRENRMVDRVYLEDLR